jgi:hypothetical protein
MLTLIRSVVAGQYGAALAMLRGCVERADSTAWLSVVGRFPYWHITYHTLYCTDMYLSPDEQQFHPQPYHRENYQFLGPQPWAPDREVVADRPYDKDTLAGYLDTCRAKAKEAMDRESEATLSGPSGFSWLDFTRLELHLYNIRHIQHHCGQLSALLRRQQESGVDWVRSQAL